MSKYAITSGTIAAPVKTVLYGPEGIGKSTFAAQFPAPVFIDTEGGTKRLNVARLPAPTSWAMLLDEVAEVSRGNVPCGTLVIDTADWAERLCIDAVCARAKVNTVFFRINMREMRKQNRIRAESKRLCGLNQA